MVRGRLSAEEQKFQETGGAAKRQTAMQRVREREREQRAQARQAAVERERAERFASPRPPPPPPPNLHSRAALHFILQDEWTCSIQTTHLGLPGHSATWAATAS